MVARNGFNGGICCHERQRSSEKQKNKLITSELYEIQMVHKYSWSQVGTDENKPNIG